MKLYEHLAVVAGHSRLHSLREGYKEGEGDEGGLARRRILRGMVWEYLGVVKDIWDMKGVQQTTAVEGVELTPFHFSVLVGYQTVPYRLTVAKFNFGIDFISKFPSLNIMESISSSSR